MSTKNRVRTTGLRTEDPLICANYQNTAKRPAGTQGADAVYLLRRGQVSRLHSDSRDLRASRTRDSRFLCTDENLVATRWLTTRKRLNIPFKRGFVLPLSILGLLPFYCFIVRLPELPRTEPTLSITYKISQDFHPEGVRLVFSLSPHTTLNASCVKHSHLPLSNVLFP